MEDDPFLLNVAPLKGDISFVFLEGVLNHSPRIWTHTRSAFLQMELFSEWFSLAVFGAVGGLGFYFPLYWLQKIGIPFISLVVCYNPHITASIIESGTPIRIPIP